MYDELVKELRHYFDDVPLVLQAADAIEELTDRNVGKWIPVTERLPDDGGYHIVYCDDGHGRRVSFAKWLKRSRCWELIATRAYWRVTHWMQLPEPPKEG